MAAKTAAVQYRNISLVQGAADAFVQAVEYTGIDAAQGFGWLLKRVELEFPLAVAIADLQDCEIAWSVGNESRATVGDLSDGNTLHAGGFASAMTTSGQSEFDKLWVYDFVDGMLVVSPVIYAQLDSSGTSLALTANMRVYFESVKLTEIEILRMLTQG